MPNNLRNPNPLTRRAVLLRALAAAPLPAALLAACDRGTEGDTVEQSSVNVQATSTASATATNAPVETAVPTSTTGTTQPPYPPEPDRHFQITTWLPTIAMNPHLGWRKTSWIASRLALQPLVEFDADLNPVLALAREWPTLENGVLDPNGRWVTWRLRQGVRWHDGEAFDADDVIATWRFATDPRSSTVTTGDRFSLVTDIERIDDHTVTVHFSEPNSQWFDLFRDGDGVILPGHIFEPLIGQDTHYEDEVNLTIPGTGPWRITSFDRAGSRVRFERFPDYWEQVTPEFDTIEVSFLSGDPTSNAQLVLETGDADYTPALEAVPPEQLSELQAASTTGQVVTVPGLGVETLFLNFADPRAEPAERRSEPDTRHPLLSDRRVRQALSLAVPRDQIAEAYGVDRAEPFVHPLAAPASFHGDGIQAAPDFARARALLDDAGVNGGTFLIRTSVNPIRQRIQEILAAAFEELGFTIELDAIDAGVFFSQDPDNPGSYGRFYADMQIYTPSFGIAPYPLEWAEQFRSNRIAATANQWSEPNLTRYANPAFDRLHDQARIEMDPERQIQLWRGMLSILTDDVVVIPLVRRDTLAAISNRVAHAGFSPWAIAPSWNLQHWTVNE